MRILGRGSFGAVGMWEYQGPNPQRLPQIQLAIKQLSLDSKDSLEGEARLMQLLGRNQSRHVLRLVRDTPDIIGPEIPKWENRVRRLIMEFCPSGDLFKLLYRPETR